MTVRAFLSEDFLLESEWASKLYYQYAADLPIIDYHCHLPPEHIFQDHRFRSLTEIWLEGDHYKWRAMRAAGVDERFITGDADDFEKFLAWARVVPRTLRNPLYHWTHMELRRPFGIEGQLLNEQSARSIFDLCGECLARQEFSARGILASFSVEVVCTTDDPVDDLRWHRQQAKDATSHLRLLPTFRPDAALALEDPKQYGVYIEQLERACNVSIHDYVTLLDALERRHTFFHEVGCRISDHGLDQPYASEATKVDADRAFQKARRGEVCTAEEARSFKSILLLDLARLDHGRGWVQQFHIGALRNANSRGLARLGPNSGFDSIDDQPMARALGRFLDRLDASEHLAKTILYSLNPRDNEVLATMAGNFQRGPTVGKVQFGAAWWFLDQLDGMEKQLDALSNLGLLSGFVGMLTDSRSFLSYSRHEYFRRLLCNILGREVERGLLPADEGLLGGLVRDVCHENAERYFEFSAK
jgi:glucuronate isomerase